MSIITSIINGILVGLLAGFCIIYVFQIKNAYPPWILHTFENPLILILLLLAAFILYRSNPAGGILLLILVIALFIDRMLFVREHPRTLKDIEEKPASPQNVTRMPEDSYHSSELLPLTYEPPTEFPDSLGYYSTIKNNVQGLSCHKNTVQETLADFKYINNMQPYLGNNELAGVDNFATF